MGSSRESSSWMILRFLFTQARGKLRRYTELVNQGMDADFATVAVLVSGETPTPLRAIRKAFVELFDLDVLSKLTLLRLCEMEVKLVGVDGAPDRTVVFGYVSPSGPDFMQARRTVLASVVAALLVVHNLERRAQHDLAAVLVVDYSAYGTSASDFETAVLSLLAYCLQTSGDSLLASDRKLLRL